MPLLGEVAAVTGDKPVSLPENSRKAEVKSPL